MTDDDYSPADLVAWCADHAVELAAAATQWELENPGAVFGEMIRAKLYPPAPVQASAEHDDGAPRAPRPDWSQASGARRPAVEDPATIFSDYLIGRLRRWR
jgi:hypothetical protein